MARQERLKSKIGYYHIMISEGIEDVAKVMKRITVSYVHYFNKKYKRVGHLFQDRYRSEVVEDDRSKKKQTFQSGRLQLLPG